MRLLLRNHQKPARLLNWLPASVSGVETWEFKLTLVGYRRLRLCQCERQTCRQYAWRPSLSRAAIRAIAIRSTFCVIL